MSCKTAQQEQKTEQTARLAVISVAFVSLQAALEALRLNVDTCIINAVDDRTLDVRHMDRGHFTLCDVTFTGAANTLGDRQIEVDAKKLHKLLGDIPKLSRNSWRNPGWNHQEYLHVYADRIDAVRTWEQWESAERNELVEKSEVLGSVPAKEPKSRFEPTPLPVVRPKAREHVTLDVGDTERARKALKTVEYVTFEQEDDWLWLKGRTESYLRVDARLAYVSKKLKLSTFSTDLLLPALQALARTEPVNDQIRALVGENKPLRLSVSVPGMDLEYHIAPRVKH